MTGDCLCLNLGLECWCARPGRPRARPHGTPAAVRRHYRRDGPGWQCVPCKQAETRHRQDRHRAVQAPRPRLPENARRVREMRQWAGMTQKALAAALGLERSWVSDRETGRRAAGPDALARIAAATGYPEGGAAGWEAAPRAA